MQSLCFASKDSAHSDGVAFDFPVELHSNPHLWSQALERDQKYEAADTVQAAKICFLCKASKFTHEDGEERVHSISEKMYCLFVSPLKRVS